MLPMLGDLCAAPGDRVAGWPISTAGTVFSSPGIGPHGEIVVGSEDNNVYSFNPNGTIRWVFNGQDWFDSSPSIDEDGTVYIGSWDNHLYSLDGYTGIMNWRFETGSLITASPTIGPNGTIYVGSYDGQMYALNSDGSLKWSYETSLQSGPINGGAILNQIGDTLFFGSDNGILYAVYTSTGTEKWAFRVPAIHDLLDKPSQRAIYGSPVLGPDEQIYFGCENGSLYEISSAGQLSARFLAADSILSSPILDYQGRIFFLSQDGYLYAVGTDDSAGTLLQLWEVFVGDVLYSTPAMDFNGNIIVAGYSGNTTIGDATTFASVNLSGVVQWTYPILALNDSSPNIAPDGSIYIGAHDGKLYKFEGEAPLAPDGWPRLGSNRRQTGWAEHLNSVELIDYFPEIEYNLSDLSYVSWFGTGWLSEVELPLIEHIDHGYLHVAESSFFGLILYNHAMAKWMFAPNSAPNYYFDLSSRSWIYHALGTNAASGRWFYDFSQTQWVTESEL